MYELPKCYLKLDLHLFETISDKKIKILSLQTHRSLLSFLSWYYHFVVSVSLSFGHQLASHLLKVYFDSH